MINEKYVLDLEKKKIFGTILNSYDKLRTKCEINYIQEKILNELYSQNIVNLNK